MPNNDFLPMKKKKDKTKKVTEQKPVKQVELPNNELPFDFGGLPSRDLKKNLGCG
jgi:hypothetical protein